MVDCMKYVIKIKVVIVFENKRNEEKNVSSKYQTSIY